MSFTTRQRTPLQTGINSKFNTSIKINDNRDQKQHDQRPESIETKFLSPTKNSTSLPNLSPSPRSSPTRSSPTKKPTPYETITFAPSSTSPSSRIHNPDEKYLLNGLTTAIKNDMKSLLKSPSSLHKKYPLVEAQKLKQRWLDLLENKVNAEVTAVAKARAATSSHLLLLRVLGKTCKVRVYEDLLNRVANFFNSVFSEVYVGALSEKAIASKLLVDLKRHQTKQQRIIIRHINRQQKVKQMKIKKVFLLAWHEEIIGKKKRMEGLQKVFLRHGRKGILQHMFRQWYAAMKNWLKARKQAEGNLSVLDGRRDAEKRILVCQNDIIKLQTEVDLLTKASDVSQKQAVHRMKQLRDAQQQTLSLMKLLDTVVYETKEEAAASEHRPLQMRVAYLEEAVRTGKIKREPKSMTIGCNTDPVTITKGIKRKKRAGTTDDLVDKKVWITEGSKDGVVAERKVPTFVSQFRRDSIVKSLSVGGHLTWGN